MFSAFAPLMRARACAPDPERPGLGPRESGEPRVLEAEARTQPVEVQRLQAALAGPDRHQNVVEARREAAIDNEDIVMEDARPLHRGAVDPSEKGRELVQNLERRQVDVIVGGGREACAESLEEQEEAEDLGGERIRAKLELKRKVQRSRAVWLVSSVSSGLRGRALGPCGAGAVRRRCPCAG